MLSKSNKNRVQTGSFHSVVPKNMLSNDINIKYCASRMYT